MMNEKRQADLLEQYVVMLRQDINAEPPYGFDPEMVDFARKLAKQSYLRPENQSPIDREIQARIWQRTIDATQVNQFEHQSEDEDDMLLSQKKSKVTTFPFATIAAVMALVLFGVMAIVATNLNPNFESLIQGAAQDETPTPAITIEPTVPFMCRVTPNEVDGAIMYGEPNQSPTQVGTLMFNIIAEVIDQTYDANQQLWYGIRIIQSDDTLTGFVRAEQVDHVNVACISPPGPIPISVPNLNEYVPVVTALQNIAFNDLITEGMLTLVYWHPDEAPADALIGQDALDNAIGQYMVQRLWCYYRIHAC